MLPQLLWVVCRRSRLRVELGQPCLHPILHKVPSQRVLLFWVRDTLLVVLLLV